MTTEMQTTRDSAGSQAPQATTRDANGARQQQQHQQQPHVVPPVDVFEDETGITLLADLPGVPRENLNLRVDGDDLLVEAVAAAQGPGGMELVYGEARHAAYRRLFTLSRELDRDRIDAQLKDGVLRLTIPKTEAAKPRRIEVRSA